MAKNEKLRELKKIHSALEEYQIVVHLNQVDSALERLVTLRRILKRIRNTWQEEKVSNGE